MPSAAARNIERVGYDLSRFDKRHRVREALAREQVQYEPIPLPKERTLDKAAEAAKTRRGVSAFSVFSYMAVTALMLLIVFNYMMLNELSIRSSVLKRELSTLKEESALLQVQYEQATDLRLLETNASALGMTKATSEQFVYIDLSTPDYAVISKSDTSSSDFLEGLKKVFTLAADYFS